LCINLFRPSRDNCRLIRVIGELEDEVNVRPFILLPSSAGTDERRSDGVRVDSRVRDQLVADPLTFQDIEHCASLCQACNLTNP
jgi:hypothetical protein